MYLVFDIGGSSNKYALIENDKIVEKFSSKQKRSMDDLLKFFEDKINSFAKNHKLDGIGFSSPGTVDSSTGNIYGKSAVEFITEYNFAMEIKNKFNLPVAIENDANCAALAEIFYGKVDKNYLAFLIIGSGIGGAITKNGKIIKGKSLEAGEFGYMLLKNEEGNFDNFSKLATLPNIRRKMIKKYGIDESTYLIFDKYMQKKEPYFTEVDQMFTYLAMGIYNIFYTVNPEKIYLGGAISSDERFVREIKNKLNTGVFKSIDIEISPVSFFNDNNLYGAYANLKQSIEEKRLLK
ncbi:ROK family protein [uncultured Anaerococcus sp.]|uniref:ROK family protein n=1 Tax=Anaerococcus sp. AH8042_DFU013_CI05 TaxID=3385202 RepID=UPI0025D99E67|nr:ROK family protein [uncultured Anaerococcus sp.]